MGAWEREVKTADHALVIKLCEEALATQTKDLWLGVWLTGSPDCARQVRGPAGRYDLLRGLIENFWDNLYPALEDGDAELRAAPDRVVWKLSGAG